MQWFAVIPFIILTALFVGMSFYVRKIMQWQARPTREKYLETHPLGLASESCRCNACGSTQIVESGLWGPASRERLFICADCANVLYRSED